MSKNFEILRETGKDLELFQTVPEEPRGGDAKSVHVNGSGRLHAEVLKLIQRTFLSGAPGAPRFVVFTGVDHGNGCSWVCARAAEALASHVEGTVCVVEANLAMPSLHRYFGVSKGDCLSDALLQQRPVRDFARSIRGTNLWLMSGPVLPSDLARIVGNRQLEMRFSELCSEFNYILMDAPPVNELAESLMLCRMADGVILVVEANSTRREAARKAKESLEAAHVRLLGAVLNKRTYPIPEVLYSRI